MLVSRLLRALLRFLSPGIVPEEGGGAPAPAPAPVADAPPAEPVESPAPAPAPEDEDKPYDLSAALDKALEPVSQEPAEPKPPEPTPAPTPAPAPKPDAKPAEIDLTPPEGMTERAQQRWSQLTERAKLVPQLELQAREATTQLQSIREMVNGSGLDANEFTDMLEMARLFKAGDAKALQRLDGLRADLATRLGVEVAGVDPLAAHPDLKADVESMTLTKERALELAKLRGKGQQADQITEGQRELQQFQQTVAAAAADMEAVLKTREATPGHEHRLKVIAEHFKQPGKLQEFVTTYEPKQWKPALLWMYENIAVPAAAPPAGPQPLRPTAARAGVPVRTGPATAESAVAGALERLGL
jgi:hypothetical protein